MSISFASSGAYTVQTKMPTLDVFEADMIRDLSGSMPPSAECIATIYLMLDTQFMMDMLQLQGIRIQGNLACYSDTGVASISNDPKSKFYAKAKAAFDYGNRLRVQCGHKADSWPLPKPPPPSPISYPVTPINFPDPEWRSRRRLIWCPEKKEILAAKSLFERFCAEGLAAFRVDESGEVVERLDSFDPYAEEVLFLGDRDDKVLVS